MGKRSSYTQANQRIPLPIAAKSLYPFHKANVHELRRCARACRAFPLSCVLATSGLSLYGALQHQALLLWMCAIFNVFLWYWVVSTAIYSIIGVCQAWGQIKKNQPMAVPRTEATNVESGDGVVHLIVLPNYKEEETMLSETLMSLAEAEESARFRVVLAMEAREGVVGQQKATRLCAEHAGHFHRISATYHPEGRKELHLDGSHDDEVSGKASNLKWAVARCYEDCKKDGSVRLADILLTVADADCIFHPCYFQSIRKDYVRLRSAGGSQHAWTMWQAPQLPYRNYFTGSVCSRVWGYVSAMYEFGGLASVNFGGHAMTYSAYSLSLQLAIQAQAWDGDVIAEDHHAFLKCFFFSVYATTSDAMSSWKPVGGCQPLLKIRPVLLPVKSTSVQSVEGYWQTWIDRWYQAKRHAHGVAELSYALLATYDAFRLMPFKLYSWSAITRIFRILLRLFCMHILPVCQTISLGTLTVQWLLSHRKVPMCPSVLRFADFRLNEYFLCGLAGTWVLVWPVVVPLILMMAANYVFLVLVFLWPKSIAVRSVWHSETAHLPQSRGSLAALGLIVYDFAFFMSWMLVPYGIFAELVAYWNVCFNGNRIAYVTASKSMLQKDIPTYGTLDMPPSGDDTTASKSLLPEDMLSSSDETTASSDRRCGA